MSFRRPRTGRSSDPIGFSRDTPPNSRIEFFVGFAMVSEIVAGLCLLLGFATRWAALGVAAIMALTIVALLNVGPFKWLWNFGGIEYNVFWCLTALAVAVTEFKRHASRMPREGRGRMGVA